MKTTDSVRALKPLKQTEKHRCWFKSSGRCACGKHRAPERAIYVEPLATDRERLSFDL